MTCPICDQKPMNCDCTATERQQYSELSDMEDTVASLQAEIERLRLAIRRLADQDATLSVVGGNVIVEMDAITDKEYAAIEIAVAWVDKFDEPDVVAALEGLLKRA